MEKISEKDLTDYLSFLSDFVSFPKDLLSFIPIPLSGTRKESVGLIWVGMSICQHEICTKEMLGMLSPTDC